MSNVIINLLTKYNDQGLQKFKGSLTDLDKKALSTAKDGIVGIGTASAAAFGIATKEALSFGNETNLAMDKLQKNLGATDEQMINLRESSKRVFAGGFGDNIEEVADAMADVSKATGRMGKALEDSTAKSLALSSAFDKDVSEIADASAALAREFDLLPEEAFDFIATGLQDGLDTSGDFLDTIREYSNLFGQAEVSASEFYSILETGSASGVLGTDKIADAFKEFSVRLVDNSDTTIAGFENIGLSYTELQEQIRDGSLSSSDAFELVISKLNEVEDPIMRNVAGVQLMGTQFEDLGEDIILNIDPAKRSLDEMAGSTESVMNTAMGLGEQWDLAMRQFLVAVEPAAQEILPLFLSGIKGVGDFLIEAQPIFTDFANKLSNTVGPAMMLIEDAATRIGVAFGVADEETTGLDLALSVLESGLDVIVTGLEAVAIAAQGLAYVIEKSKEAIETLSELDQKLQNLTSGTGAIDIIGSFTGLSSITQGARGLGIPGFQHGVSNFSGGMALVGERGPEIVNLPRGSDVIPNGGGTGAIEAAAADMLGRIMAQVATQVSSGHFNQFVGELNEAWG